jgi:hypothetical protein
MSMQRARARAMGMTFSRRLSLQMSTIRGQNRQNMMVCSVLSNAHCFVYGVLVHWQKRHSVLIVSWECMYFITEPLHHAHSIGRIK